MRKLFLFIIFSLSTFLHSQILDKKFYLIDSLDRSRISESDFTTLNTYLTKYHSEKSDTGRLKQLNALVENVYDEKIWPRYNQLMLKTSIEKLKNCNSEERKYYESSRALGLNNIGYYYFNFSDKIDSALYYYNLALKVNEEIKDYDNLVVSYSNIANVYQNRGELLKAMELYNQALNLEQKVKVKIGILSSLNNISNIYLYLGDTTQSLLHLKKCFLLAKKSNNQDMKAHLLHNIGMLLKGKNYNEALQSIKSSYQIRKQIGDKKGMAQSLLAMAGFANMKNNSGLADQYLNEAKPIVFSLHNELLMALYERTYGELLVGKGQKKDGVTHLMNSLSIYEKLNASNDALETIRGAISEIGNDKTYTDIKLELYEKFYYYNKIINKSAVQKLSLQNQYENQIKLKDAEFKAAQEIKDEKSRAEKKVQQNISIAIGFILIITLIFSYFIYNSLKQNKEKNIEISKQKHLIEEKQKEIIDSINYSKRIQNSFLPTESDINESFPGSFVIYKPKDIVSGDFYWMMDSRNYTTIQKNFRSIAVADCTGHGVPGAILSMLGSSILNQAILDKHVMSSANLLDFLNSELKKNLRSKSNEIIRDGMDIGCCIIFNDTLKMQFSGANNPCWIIRENTIIELKANKQAVTAAIEENAQSFTLTEFQLQKNDQIFLFTDGYADQFGGPKGKKFKYKQLEKTLIESTIYSAHEQKNYILNKFSEWKGDLEQVDDVCIVGLRI